MNLPRRREYSDSGVSQSRDRGPRASSDSQCGLVMLHQPATSSWIVMPTHGRGQVISWSTVLTFFAVVRRGEEADGADWGQQSLRKM